MDKNKYEKLFDSFLDLTEFSLIKHRDGFGLEDRQGANLGDIEDDRYKLEIAYDKLGRYDEEYDKALEHAKEMNEFYSNLMRKLKEVL